MYESNFDILPDNLKRAMARDKLLGKLGYHVWVNKEDGKIGYGWNSDIEPDEIIVPEGVTEIMSTGLAGMASKRIRLPQSLRVIGAEAFSNCYNLEEVVIPDSVEFIGRKAFTGCNKLKSISCKATVVKGAAFTDCSGLLVVELPNVVDLDEGSVFSHCSSLEQVNLPSVRTIGVNTFYNCYNLSFVGLGEFLERIGYNAFNGCDSLEELVLPSSLKVLSVSLFGNVRKLNKLYISRKTQITEFVTDWFEINYYD